MVRFYGWDARGNPVTNWTVAAAFGMAEADIFGVTSAFERRRCGIAYDEPVALIREIVAGGTTHQLNGRELLNWCVRYEIQPNEWPAGIIAKRLSRICDANEISADEWHDINFLLADIAGESQLLVCEPEEIPFTGSDPLVEFSEKEFVFAGRFLYGRQACIDDLRQLGGRHCDSVTSQTDYLVIGAIQSCDWNNSSIKLAVDAARLLAASSAPSKPQIAIISEKTWLKSVSQWPAHLIKRCSA